MLLSNTALISIYKLTSFAELDVILHGVGVFSVVPSVLARHLPQYMFFYSSVGAERQRREAEKRALEEKMAALKRASETRDALADFTIGGVPGASSQPLAPAQSGTPGKPLVLCAKRNSLLDIIAAGRPRMGDYMEFYRSKMAASRPPAGHVTPPPQFMPGAYQPAPQISPAMPDAYPGSSHPSAVPQSPSPAPSSIHGILSSSRRPFINEIF